MESGNRILPRELPETAGTLQELLEAEGIKFMLDATVSAFTGAKTARISGASEAWEHSIRFDVALVSIGRKPNVLGLDVEKAGIQIEKGMLNSR